MASSLNSVWAVDIGSNALKALRVAEGEDGLEVIGFDYVEHSNILTSEDVEPNERSGIIAESMRKFASRNDVSHESVAISVAGHNSFARFIKLPPVEQKRIPEIVQFEAVQQIPFDINEVEWGWQLMENPESEETEVGLFAIKNELIAELMDHFASLDMQVCCVQIAPIALHNYANYDRDDLGTVKDKATVVLDMGADNTTLVVSTKDTVWQRSIRIGGNTFTESIQDKFDVSFRKAEKLKRTALLSKYVRQIFSAMKPIYTDLGSEVQRSLGFYSSSGPGRDKGFARIIAVGGGMKLKGVAKYLQQTLGVPVEKLDSMKKIKLGEGLDEAKFHENISDYIVPYGLAVQVLTDDPAIKSNLLPRKMVRAMEWAKKAKVLTVAACVFLLVSVLGLGRVLLDSAKYSSGSTHRNQISRVLNLARTTESEYSAQTALEEVSKKKIEVVMNNFKYREVVPELAQTILECIPGNYGGDDDQQRKLIEALKRGDVSAIKSIPREERKLLFITSMEINYAPVISKGSFKTPKSGGNNRNYDNNDDTGEDMMNYEEFAGPGYEEMYGPPGGVNPMGGPPGMPPLGPTQGANTKEDENDGPGFVVTIEGYSPYKDIGKLLDPPHVSKKNTKGWGIVTWFESLGKKGAIKRFQKMPFELYTKDDTKHYKQEHGPVEYNSKEMPIGIGEVEEVTRFAKEEETNANNRPAYGASPYGNPYGAAAAARPVYGGMGGIGNGLNRRAKVETETVLIDPMTKEEMSKTLDFYTQQDIDSDPSKDENDLGMVKIDLNGNQKYITRDHWFRINVKFLWKDAPEDATKKQNNNPFSSGPFGPGPGGPGGPPMD